MSNEEQLEEVLHKAHKLGIVKEIMSSSDSSNINTFREEIINNFNKIIRERNLDSPLLNYND